MYRHTYIYLYIYLFIYHIFVTIAYLSLINIALLMHVNTALWQVWVEALLPDSNNRTMSVSDEIEDDYVRDSTNIAPSRPIESKTPSSSNPLLTALGNVRKSNFKTCSHV
jgi:hypothetical protein